MDIQVVSGIRYSMVIVVLVGDEPVYYQVDVVSQVRTNPTSKLIVWGSQGVLLN